MINRVGKMCVAAINLCMIVLVATRKRGDELFHIGADIWLKKHSRKITASILTPFSELLPNLYYSPIKKLENIFIFKIARQQRP
jgi:hypothetical protein